MATITKIEIEGFKAFPTKFSLDLPNGENLLIYGENGSGKSSIYYALHALLQSVFKDDKGAKYFKVVEDSSTGTGSIINSENLVNLYRVNEAIKNEFQPYVRLALDNGHVWRLDRSGLISETGSSESEIRIINRNAFFINHSYISRFHSARNSEDIDLWNVFIKDILPFCIIDSEEKSLADIFYDIIAEIPHGKKEINNIKKRIKAFNELLSIDIIGEINKHATDIYNNYFKNEDDPSLAITLQYYADDDTKNNPLNEKFYLSFDKSHGAQYSFRVPRIGLVVISNGQPINKPQSFFNEAKLTAIALSVRFALLNWGSSIVDGRFLALDDMLISLDMSNRMKVISFLLDITSKKYKVYIFTHDRLFYHTIKRIIETQYDPKVWMFGGLYINDDKEPITPEYKSDNNSKINSINDAYSLHDYFRCGTLLRQLCERCLKDLLPSSYRSKEDSKTKLTVEKNLDEQIMSLEDFCEHEGIDFKPFRQLKSYKDLFLNSSAHNDITSPYYRQEIKACKKALEELSKIKRSKEIKCKKDLSFQIILPDDTHTIRLRLREEKLLLLEYGLTKRISYYSKCEVINDICKSGETRLNEGFGSIYEAYKSAFGKYGVEFKGDILDSLSDRDGLLRDRL